MESDKQEPPAAPHTNGTSPTGRPKPPGECCYRSLSDGSVELRMHLGVFVSLPEAEKAAAETSRDLGFLWSLRKLQDEIASGTDIGGERQDQMEEQVWSEMCGIFAQDLGTTELWEQSQKWPNFRRAWQAWVTS